MIQFFNSLDARRQAIMLRIGVAIVTSIGTALAKSASMAGANAVEIIFSRSMLSLPVVVLWVMSGPGLASVRTKRPMAHLTRAVVGYSALVASFTAITMLPLAEATTIFFLTPLVATALSSVMLQERVGWHRWLAIGVGFMGAIILAGPTLSGGLPPTGVLVAFGSVIGVACVTITVRQLGSTEPATTTVFWFTLFASIMGGLAIPFYIQPHDWTVWLRLSGLGITGALGQIFITGSLKLAPVSVTAPFDYLQLIFVMILGWVLWSHLPGASTLVGAFLIAGAGLYTVYREHLRNRSIAAAATTPQEI